MQTVKAIDDIVAALRTSIANWERQIAAKREDLMQLEGERAGWRRKAIRDGDTEAQGNLDALRSVASFLSQEIEDYESELNRANAELEMLVHARVEAAKEEAWAGFMAMGKEVIDEAKTLEKFLTDFLKLAKAHAEKLEKMNSMSKNAGVDRRIADQKHLWRRFTALMRQQDPHGGWGRQNETYESKPYHETLAHVFEVANRQRSGGSEQRAVNE